MTPHLQEHLGDVATLDLIYRAEFEQHQRSRKNALPGLGISSTNSLGQSVELVIGSAESFGSLGLKLDLKHTSDTGSGMNTASTTDADSLGGTYHINRIYALNASLGYQATDYPASGTRLAYHNSGLTWSLGATFTPNDQSNVTLGYGYQQGAYNPNATVSYSLGPLTKVTASYIVTIQNQLSSTLQNQKFLAFDQFGNPIDSRTGLPFNAVNQTFGSQNILFRDKPAILAISHQFVRSAGYGDRTI